MKASSTVHRPARKRSVLTGDLVLSEGMTRAVRRSVPPILDGFADDLREMEIDVSDVDVFRGDGWQMIVRMPGEALRAAVYIRAAGLASPAGLDTRVAIGIGEIEDEGSGGISSGFGSAFTHSGRTLDAMPKDRRIRMAFEAETTGSEPALLDASLYLLDRVSAGWTSAQARVITAAMKGLSQEEIGATWAPRPISQQAVAQHMARASWHAVDQYVKAWTSRIEHLVVE